MQSTASIQPVVSLVYTTQYTACCFSGIHYSVYSLLFLWYTLLSIQPVVSLVYTTQYTACCFSGIHYSVYSLLFLWYTLLSIQPVVSLVYTTQYTVCCFSGIHYSVYSLLFLWYTLLSYPLTFTVTHVQCCFFPHPIPPCTPSASLLSLSLILLLFPLLS